MILLILAALTATPATLPATLAKARCGDEVTLRAGQYGALNAPRVDCSDNPIEIDASAATVTSLVARSTKGIIVRGGTVRAAAGSVAVTIDYASHVRVSGMLITGARAGISITRSTDIEASGNRLDGLRADGITISQVQRARIIGNACLNFAPIQPTFDAAGKRVVEGDHPDCIQGWSVKGTPPTADVLIAGNTAIGPMQGVWFGNPGQGGYDRITVRDNTFQISAFNGVVVLEGRGTVLRNNRVMPIPGARMVGGNGGLVWPWVKATGDAIACGNVVAAQASRYGTGACK